MDLIERIGPALGIIAFLGLSALVFFIFQQGREVRRLREWAGRAPERAQEAADASLAAAQARGEAEAQRQGTEEPGRLAQAWSDLKETVAPRWRSVDRRLPVDARYLLAGLVVVVVAAGVLTSGFGLGGGGSDGGHGHSRSASSSPKPSVAVLNGTNASGAGVPQLAAKVEGQVVKPAGYRAGTVTNTSSSFQSTVVMYAPGHGSEAKALATAVEPKLGPTGTQPMTQEVLDLAGQSPLALVIGLDDATFGAAQ